MEPVTGSGAVKRRLPPQLQRIADLPRSRQLMLAGACLAILAIIAAILLWNRDPEYGVLFSNLDDKDGGDVIAALTAQNVEYRIADNGHAILVPASKVHELRLNLATQGLPKGGSVGFELMDNQRLGISQFAEQVNYQRALEGELSRTIQSLAVVRDAKVHLAIPKPSVFIRENEKPTASVLLTMHPGRVLDETQIMGITHLVSSSVPNLPNAGVRIVDQNGNLLNPFKDESAHAGLDGKQLFYVRGIEEEMVKRIEKILEPTSGIGNARAQVTVDVDFSRVEQTEETYRPNSEPNEQAIRSRTSKEAEMIQPATGGVPGAFSNQPPQPPQAPIATDNAPPPVTGQPGGSPLPADQLLGPNATANQNQPTERMRESTQNFEVDKKVTHIQNAVGNNIRRLTAAVVVNNKKIVDDEGNVTYSPYTEEELAKVTDLVRQAVGFDPKRGDTVSVANIAFDPDVLAREQLSFWEDPGKLELIQLLVSEFIKYLIVLLLALYLIFGVIRPIMKPPAPPEEEPLALAGLGQSPFSLRPRTEEEIAAEAAQGAAGIVARDEEEEYEGEEDEEEEGEEGEEGEEDEEEYSSGIEKFLVQKPPYQSDLDFAKELALAEPKIVSKVIRDWMSPSGGA